jgi:hypothetical protein
MQRWYAAAMAGSFTLVLDRASVLSLTLLSFLLLVLQQRLP